MVTRKDMKSRRDEYVNSLMRQRIISAVFFNLKKGEEGKEKILLNIGGDRNSSWIFYSSQKKQEESHSGFISATDSVEAHIDSLHDKLDDLEKKYSRENSVKAVVDISGRSPVSVHDEWNIYSYFSGDNILKTHNQGIGGMEINTIMEMVSENLEWSIFPYPYFADVNPMIKLLMLNDNFFLNGKWKIENILQRAVSLCTMFSADTTRDQVRLDLSSVLTTAIKSGVLVSRGGYITMPKSEAAFTRTFLSKYIDYEERLGKTTLFDFESLKLNY
jgi:hypothetical protein